MVNHDSGAHWSQMKTQNRTSRLICFLRSASVLLAVAALTLTALHSDEGVHYPDGFRRWVHVGTGVILPDQPSAEERRRDASRLRQSKAAEAYVGGDFPDGSVIVYELRETQQNNGVITEGARRRVDVMIKDSNLNKSTGGWRFERFFGDQQAENAIHDPELLLQLPLKS